MSVVAVAAETEPSPDATAKLTVAPATGRLSAASTRTRSGWAKATFCSAVWASPEILISWVGTGSTRTCAESRRPVSDCATIHVSPRTATRFTVPDPRFGTVAMAGLRETKPMMALLTTLFCAS